MRNTLVEFCERTQRPWWHATSITPDRMKDTLRIFLIILAASITAYFFLHVVRSFNIAAEWRGLWAGAAGYMAANFVATATRKRRGKR